MTEIICERRKRSYCAWSRKKRTKIFVALNGNGIEYVQSLNLSHFDRAFGTKNPRLITDFSTKNSILTVHHSPYSPNLAPCDFYSFGKLHLVMKGKRYVVIEDIQRSTNAILNIIFTCKIKMSFDSLLDCAKRCIESKRDYFK